ncbi:MAG: dihydrofolate reductase family protein [Thermoplasmata archaeon]|nr:dihydrofolate reductase family protein [Thermoplasmata archaeon]
MRKVYAMMFMTLDGVAEFPDYDPEPESGPSESEEPMWSPRMGSIDTLLLGRVAYEKWYSYWPAKAKDPEANAWQKTFSEFCDRSEKLVVSKSLRKVDWPNSRIVLGDIGDEIARVRALPGKDIALGGGPRLLQTFLDRRLVDELRIEVFPSLVGRGKPMFHVVDDPDNPEDVVPVGAAGRRDFQLFTTKHLKGGTVFLHYRTIAGKNPA